MGTNRTVKGVISIVGSRFFSIGSRCYQYSGARFFFSDVRDQGISVFWVQVLSVLLGVRVSSVLWESTYVQFCLSPSIISIVGRVSKTRKLACIFGFLRILTNIYAILTIFATHFLCIHLFIHLNIIKNADFGYIFKV